MWTHAGVTLDQRRRVDDLELVAVFEDFDIFMRRDGNDRQSRALGLPAFRAAASVIMGDLSLDADLHRAAAAQADENAALEVRVCRLHAVVNRGVEFQGFRHRFLLRFRFTDEPGAPRRSCRRPICQRDRSEPRRFFFSRLSPGLPGF
jgi:hypothetical protein